MDKSMYLDPPNRPMDTNFQPNQGPILHKDLIFLDVDAKERLLVGSTNVTASFWEGSFQVFTNYKAYEDKTWQSFYNSSIIYDGKLLSKHNSVLISEGISFLKLFSIPDESGHTNEPWQDCVENIAKVRQIIVNEEETKVLTVSDKFLSVWDLEQAGGGIKKVVDYTDYHTDDIKAAAMKKGDCNVFASVGLDRRVCLWDSRMENPATELYRHDFCGLTAISWNPINTNSLCFGSEAGDLYMIDINQPKDLICYKHCYQAPIYNIKFNDSGYLAICGNTTELIVYNCIKNDFDFVFKTKENPNFIRGLSWLNNSLYACGLDNCLIKHSF